jgi:hypothetical protein
VQAIEQTFSPSVLGKTIVNENDFTVHSLQLFNGSAGNISKYFSSGTGKDQSTLLPDDNGRG